MNRTGRPSWTDWSAAAPELRLRRRGIELVGPCPACGGTDRFSVRKSDAGAVIFCRSCTPGRGNPDAFRHILNAAGFHLDRQSAENRSRDSASRRNPGPRHGPPAESTARDAAAKGDPGDVCPIRAATRIWAATVVSDGTPARAYLARRLAWPPAGIGPNLPESVRWLPTAAAPAEDRAGRWYGLPSGAAGAITFAWRRTGDSTVVAVSLEALAANGARLVPRWRRTFGHRTGTAFTATAPTGATAIVVTEGEVSALACRWQHPGATVQAAGGTSGLVAWRPEPGDRRPVVIAADGDAAGDRAAAVARDAIVATTATVQVEWRRAGDPADDWAAELLERTAIREHDDGLTRDAALAVAWRDIVAEHGTDVTCPALLASET